MQRKANKDTYQIKLKFLGMGLQVQEVRRIFEEARKASPVPVALEVIDQPNDILRHDIGGIPTLYIGEQIFAEGRMPSAEELGKGIAQHYSTIVSNDMKEEEEAPTQRILVPIDPSDTAMTALRHAMYMAGVGQGVVVHALHVGALHIAAEQPIVVQNLNSLREARMEAIHQRITKALGGEAQPAEVMYELGIPADVITDMSKDYDLIVMGSTGEHGFLDRLLGSISSSVAQRAHCPVMLIPHGLGNVDFRRVMYACKADHIYPSLVDELLKVAGETAFEEIHFVEIIKPLQGEHTRLDRHILQEIIKHNLDDIHFHVDQIRNESVVEGLNEYAAKNDIGMVVMSTKHRGPIQALFHKSQTKQMVLDIERPLLVLHEE